MMLKKAASSAGGGALKEQYNKLLDRLTKNIEDADKLMSQSNLPSYSAFADQNVLSNLLPECENSAFW